MEVYEKVKLDSVKAVEEYVIKHFKEKVWIYAVLDYAVGFGVFENEQFLLRSGNQKPFQPLEWKYLQELRVFNRAGELRLSSFNEQWVGRVRRCATASENTSMIWEEYCMDECQKIWGKVKDVKDTAINNGCSWSLLSSDRGTRIWVPLSLGKQEEAAVCVRKFMRVPSIDYPELVYQTDIRMVDFCIFKENVIGGAYDYE